MKERPVCLPQDEVYNLRPVYDKDRRIVGKVLLTPAGLLAEQISAETGLPFNPMDFAMGVMSPYRSIRYR